MSDELRSVANQAYLSFADQPRVVEAKRGVGTFLLFDLANDEVRRRKHPDYTVWVYLCDWVIRHGGKDVADSDFESPVEVDSVLSRLRGETLIDLRLAAKSTSATLDFTGGWQIELQEATDIYEPGSDLVRIFATGKLAAAVSYPGGMMVAPIVQNGSVADLMKSERANSPHRPAARFLSLRASRRPRNLKRA
jgi:hypothetical protein